MELDASQASFADYSMSDFEEDADDVGLDTDTDAQEKKDDREELDYDASDSDMEHTLNNLPSLPPSMSRVKEADDPKEESDKRSTLSPTPSDSGRERVLLEIDGRFELVNADDIRARDLGELASGRNSPNRSDANISAELSTGGEREEPAPKYSKNVSEDRQGEEKQEVDRQRVPTSAEPENSSGAHLSAANSVSSELASPAVHSPVLDTHQLSATDAKGDESGSTKTSSSTAQEGLTCETNTSHVAEDGPRTKPGSPASSATSLQTSTTITTTTDGQGLTSSASKSLGSDSTKRPDSSPLKSTLTSKSFTRRSTSAATQKAQPRRGKSAVAGRSDEEARQRKAKEEERRADAQAAFEGWLAIKREKEVDENKKRAALRQTKKMEEQRMRERQEECNDAFNGWLTTKSQQLMQEKKMLEKEKQLLEEQAVLISDERNQQAYRQWLHKKNQEKKAERHELMRRHRAHVQEARKIHRSLQARYNTLF